MDHDESLASYRRRFDGATVFTYTIAILAVAAKLCSQKIRVGWSKIGYDSWLAIATLGLATVFLVINMVGLRPLLGRHADASFSTEELVRFIRWSYAMFITYLLSVAFVKFTTLAMYWQLFSLGARIPIKMLAAATFIWMTAILFLFIFGCNLPKAQWDSFAADGNCVDSNGTFLGTALPNILLDVLIVLVPIKVVLGLKMPTAQRIIIGGMFALGFFICIVSIVRVVITLSNPFGDSTYNQRDYIIWTTVEVNLGLVCSCLPSLRPLLTAIGLERIFPSITRSRNKATADAQVSHPPCGESSTRTKAAGIFAALARLSPRNDHNHEGAFQMADKAVVTSQQRLKDNSHVDVEAQRASMDTDVEAQRASMDTDAESGRGHVSASASQKDSGAVVGQQDLASHIEKTKDFGASPQRSFTQLNNYIVGARQSYARLPFHRVNQGGWSTRTRVHTLLSTSLSLLFPTLVTAV